MFMSFGKLSACLDKQFDANNCSTITVHEYVSAMEICAAAQNSQLNKSCLRQIPGNRNHWSKIHHLYICRCRYSMDVHVHVHVHVHVTCMYGALLYTAVTEHVLKIWRDYETRYDQLICSVPLHAMAGQLGQTQTGGGRKLRKQHYETGQYSTAALKSLCAWERIIKAARN